MAQFRTIFCLLTVCLALAVSSAHAYSRSGILHDEFGRQIANTYITINAHDAGTDKTVKTDSLGFFKIDLDEDRVLWSFRYKTNNDSGYGRLIGNTKKKDSVDYVLFKSYLPQDARNLIDITDERLDSAVIKILVSDKINHPRDTVFLELFKINDHVKTSVLHATTYRYARALAVEYLLYVGDLELLRQVLDDCKYWAPIDHFHYSILIMSMMEPVLSEFGSIVGKWKMKDIGLAEQLLYALALNQDPASLSLIKSINKHATDIIKFKESYPTSIPFSEDINASINIAFQIINTTAYDHAGTNKHEIKAITFDRNKTKALVTVYVGGFSGCEYNMVFHQIDGRWVLKYIKPTFIYN